MILLYTCRLESRWVFYMSTLTTLHWGWRSWSNAPKSLIKLSTPRRKKKSFATQSHWTLRLLRMHICSSCSISIFQWSSLFLHLSTRFISLSLTPNNYPQFPANTSIVSGWNNKNIWADAPTDGSCERCPRDDNIDKEDRDRSCCSRLWWLDLLVSIGWCANAALNQRFKSYHFVMIHLPIRGYRL